MLSRLYIENIAVIEKAEIEFSAGFNVLTGETGAGKSILIDSICAVLGERTSRELIRTGASSAFVSAEFAELSQAAQAGLERLGVLVEDNLVILGREIRSDGRSGFRINGRPTSGSVLREVGRLLINIHGQHENQALLDPARHMGYLDLMLEDSGCISDYKAAYEKYRRLSAELEKLNNEASARSRRMDLLSYRVDEIENAEITVGEADELLSRRKMYQNYERIAMTLSDADSYLSGGENETGCVDDLDSANELLSDISDCCDDAKRLSDRLFSLLCELRDAASELHELCYSMEYDPSELENIEQRLDILRKIIRKYGSEEKALSFCRKAKRELSEIEDYDGRRSELEQQCDDARKDAERAAQALTKARRDAALSFCSRVGDELKYLDLPCVRLEASFTVKEMDSSGADSMEFLISVNPGEPPRPISKIASGGELSRIMLAIKNVLADKDDIDTLIFDEVDTGISGRAAHKVGVKLGETAENRQIICVTHLAQIASFAQRHLFIEKFVDGGRTYTKVRPLSFAERVRELARINGGDNITDAMLTTAEEMLVNAGNRPD